jgi:DNA modification methylase
LDYRTTRLFRFQWAGVIGTKGRKRNHPMEKPPELMRWSIGWFKDVGGVADPYMGSGGTGVAAVGMGLEFYGCEMVPEYFETARQRIEAALKKPRLLS